MKQWTAPLFVQALFVLCKCELPVVISRGAVVTPLRNVVVYDDVELIHHIISDLPDVPSSIVRSCPVGASKKSCELTTHLHNLLEDNSKILTILNRARTTYGLNAESLPEVSLSTTAFRPVQEQQSKADPLPEQYIKLVGKEWYNKLQQRLLERKPFQNGSESIGNLTRLQRFVPPFIAPLLVGTAAVLGADELYSFGSKLFVGENGLLKFLTTLAATTTDQSIVDLSKRVSKFEAETRRLNADMAEEADEIKRITEELQVEVAKHKVDLAFTEDSHIVSQQIIGDLGNILFTFAIYFSTMDADTNCRGGYISPLLLPPNMLAEKILETAALLPSDMKLAIGLDNIQAYYTTKSASCMYDSHGGLLTVPIPIVYKTADYQLYEYRSLFFAWKSKTCVLDASSRYVVKDLKMNTVFPIEEVDMEKCQPYETRRCKKPPASDNTDAYCLTQLLSSSTVAQVRDGCKMSCFKKNDTIISKLPLSPNTFVGVHVPPDSLTITCPNHPVYNVTEKVEYGSLRIITGCSCILKLHRKTVGITAGPHCQGHETVSLDVLIPGHWTTLTDFLPFTSDGQDDGTKFQHRDEIFNEHYMDDEESDESVLTTDISIINVIWSLIHSCLIAYTFFRLNVIAGATAVALTGVQMVEASEHHYCRLEEDVYIILYVVCGLCSLLFLPPIIWKVYSFLTSQFWWAVNNATDQRIASGHV